EIPPSFLDATRIPALVRELSRHVKEPADADGAGAEAEPADAAVPDRTTYQPPQVAQRKVLASRLTWPLFAPVVAAAAWAWGFQGAAREAFVGDGSANHWRVAGPGFWSGLCCPGFIPALLRV